MRQQEQYRLLPKKLNHRELNKQNLFSQLLPNYNPELKVLKEERKRFESTNNMAQVKNQIEFLKYILNEKV